MKFVKEYNAKAVFVDKNNKVYVSDGVEFTLTAKDYKIISFKLQVEDHQLFRKNKKIAYLQHNSIDGF